MTEQEILEYNKRCAEFLGYELVTPSMRNNPDKWVNSYWELKHKSRKNPSKNLIGRDGYLEFHSNWNWIMEVVESIEKLNINKFAKQLGREDVTPIDGKFYLHTFDTEAEFLASVYYWQRDNNIEGLTKIKGLTKKEAVVQAINQFLIWYFELENNS